ncbi:hypothetical protein Jiend_59740 [Micromonospora endophytica]|nr:hypothetical protein Jiend_59740 [Micromonospora endophytica]
MALAWMRNLGGTVECRPVPARQIRARYSSDTITVYQGVSPANRIAGGGSRPLRSPLQPGQERVLSIDITREGFEWSLARGCLSHYDRDLHGDKATWSRHLKSSPVRVQWDPERSLHLTALPYRSLQVGLSREAVDRYVDDWVVTITDITPMVQQVRELLRGDNEQATTAQLPVEHVYPLPDQIGTGLNASPDLAHGKAPEQSHGQ